MGKRLYCNDNVLDWKSYATLDGRKVARKPQRYRNTAETPDADHLADEALRLWLAERLGQGQFDEAFHVLAEGQSCRELGEETEQDRSTACRKRQRLREQLKRLILSATWKPLSPNGATRQTTHERLIRLRRQVIADAVLEVLQEGDGGCTIDVHAAEPVPPLDIWAVSLFGYEKRFVRFPTVTNFVDYLACYEDVLAGPEKIYLGVWFDSETDEWVLDLSQLHDLEKAIAVGLANRQKSIVNLLTRQLLWLDADQGRRAA